MNHFQSIKLNSNNNPSSMVQDPTTNLIWETKTDDGSIHDFNHKFTWNDAINLFINYLNKTQFGGFIDWRLPTVRELESLVNNLFYNPSIDTNYFPNTHPSCYWTCQTKGYETDDVFEIGNGFIVDFFRGCIINDKKSNFNYVRAVRSS